MNFPKATQTFLVTILLALGSQNAIAVGTAGTGGGSSDKITREALYQIVVSDSYNLKSSLTNYLNTIKLEQIGDSATKQFLTAVPRARVVEDIWKSPYKFDSGCVENVNGQTIAARTAIGSRAAVVCFDSEALFEQLNQLSAEEATIRIAALAFHEHVHHFQDEREALDKNEAFAYQVSAYVQTTARFAQVPLLQWEGAKPFMSQYLVTNRCERSGVGHMGRFYYRFDINTSVLPTTVGIELVQKITGRYGVSAQVPSEGRIITLTGWTDLGFQVFLNGTTLETEAREIFKTYNEKYPNSVSVSCNLPK